MKTKNIEITKEGPGYILEVHGDEGYRQFTALTKEELLQIKEIVNKLKVK